MSGLRGGVVRMDEFKESTVDRPELPGITIPLNGGIHYCPHCAQMRHTWNELYQVGDFCYSISKHCSTCYVFVNSTMYYIATQELVGDVIGVINEPRTTA